MTDSTATMDDTTSILAEIKRARARRRRQFVGRLLAHNSFLIGCIILLLLVAVAVFAPFLAPYDPTYINYRSMMVPPSVENWFGTDAFGRDIASRVIYGTRVSLRIALVVVAATGVIGTLLGTLAGYVGWLDGLIMRTLDGLMAFPGVLLAIALAAALGPSEVNAIIALTVTFTPRTARIVRASVMVVQGDAIRRGGASRGRESWTDHLSLYFSQLPVAVDRATDLCLHCVDYCGSDPQLFGSWAASTCAIIGQYHC